MGKNKYDCGVDNDLKTLHWLSIKKRIIFKIALLVYKFLNGLAPPYLQELFHFAHHSHIVRLKVPSSATKYGSRAFIIIGPRIYNSLPQSIKESENVLTFKQSLKTYLFHKYDIELIYDPNKSVIEF